MRKGLNLEITSHEIKKFQDKVIIMSFYKIQNCEIQ